MQTEMRQTSIADAIIAEMEQEAVTTKKLLTIVPEDKLSWRPHPKAMTLGQLALHIAGLQGSVSELGQNDIAVDPEFSEPEAATRDQILATFDESLAKAKSIIGSTDDERARQEWSLSRNGSNIVTMPRTALWRSILMNHYYHHRGQLSTYLRTLDVPLPSIYGPSADENPFG